MYLEIDEGFPGHRKTLRLCAALRNPEAGWFCIRLWTWACRSAPDGDLSGMDPYDIEIAVQYRELDGRCYAALVSAGFIDATGDGKPTRIHNWASRTGASIKRMVDEAARKKVWRDAHAGIKCTGKGTCAACAAIKRLSEGLHEDSPRAVRGLSDGHPADFSTQTRPDQSSPDQIPPPAGAPARDPRTPEPEPTSSPFHQPTGLTGPALAKLFGRVRCEMTGAGLEWQGTPTSPEKASNMAAAIETSGSNVAEAEATIREFWRRAKAGTLPKSAEIVRSPSFAFGCWCSAFPELLEALRGKAPRAPPDPGARCAFHQRPGTSGKRARFHDSACSECRHAHAGAGSRESEPAPTPLPTFQPPAAWTPEQREEYAQLTRRATP